MWRKVYTDRVVLWTTDGAEMKPSLHTFESNTGESSAFRWDILFLQSRSLSGGFALPEASAAEELLCERIIDLLTQQPDTDLKPLISRPRISRAHHLSTAKLLHPPRCISSLSSLWCLYCPPPFPLPLLLLHLFLSEQRPGVVTVNIPNIPKAYYASNNSNDALWIFIFYFFVDSACHISSRQS